MIDAEVAVGNDSLNSVEMDLVVGHIHAMTAEQVRKAREHAPFKPFTLFLSDQRKFEIRHPDFLWVIPGGRSIAIADENGAAEIIDLLHVTSLRTNGAAKS